MSRNLNSLLKAVISVENKAQAETNAVEVTNAIDRFGYDSVLLVLLTGTLAVNAAKFAVKVQHNDVSDAADTGWSDADDGEVLGDSLPFTGANDNKLAQVSYIGTKRYVRLHITPSANTGAWAVSVLGILGFPLYGPSS